MAIIDNISYLGTNYEIADSQARTDLAGKATVPTGGTDGQVMLKKGTGFEWGLPGAQNEDVVSSASFNINATQCVIYIEIPSDEDYAVQIYSSNPALVVTSIDKSTAGQLKVKFNRQSAAGSLCAVARKVGSN